MSFTYSDLLKALRYSLLATLGFKFSFLWSQWLHACRIGVAKYFLW